MTYTPEQRAADAVIHNAIYGPWDETRCRVCGWPVKEKIRDGCIKEVCAMVDREGKRADEPRRFHESHDAKHALLEWLAADEGRWQAFERNFYGLIFSDAPLVSLEMTIHQDLRAAFLATPAQVAEAVIRMLREGEK